MLGRVKQYLGIEGVKVELRLDRPVMRKEARISGLVYIASMTRQRITQLSFKVIERYARGRRKDKLVDEFVLGEEVLPVDIEIPAGEPLTYPFVVAFTPVHSPMDQFEQSNILFRGLAKAAKAIKGVQSEYRIEVEARVLGTAFSPFDRQLFELR